MKKAYVIVIFLLVVVGCDQNNMNTTSNEFGQTKHSIELKDADTSKNKAETNDTRESDKSIETQSTNNTDQSTNDLSKRIDDYIQEHVDSEYFSDTEIYNMYRQVLLSEITFSFEFVVSESEKEYYLNNISSDDYKFTPYHFSLIDMNGDKIPEIVIEGTIGESAGFVLVLREHEGKIIGYEFSHRQMSDIKKDGTYHASGGAAYNGYYQLSFSDDSYSQNNIVRMDTEEDSDGNYKQIFFIDDKQVDENDFWEFWEIQENKEGPKWVVFEDIKIY